MDEVGKRTDESIGLDGGDLMRLLDKLCHDTVERMIKSISEDDLTDNLSNEAA